MKTVVYVRVSSENQSCEAQLHAISTFLKIKGITEYQIYQDEGISGASTNRPQLKALLNDCKQGKVELLVVWKLDRLFRSLTDLLGTLKELDSYNVKFVSVQENIDLTTPAGTLMMQIIGAMAQFERAIGVERTKSGLANARSKGIKLGRPVIMGNMHKQQILDLRDRGCSYNEIVRALGISYGTVFNTIKKHRLAVELLNATKE